ncbi:MULTISPECIES: heptaprenyl diphosphate synthase component II [Bacillaceae]|uniref:heptaprenyl diphosphate synthase component II n=1 Tax=Bacillaceae TaxID=186817 RepID=UPI002FFFF8DB
MKLKMMYSFLNSDINLIEKKLGETIHTDSLLLKQASMHTLQAGGKRIRPVFVLLAGKFGHYDIHIMKDVAVALELIHMASLVHDDVIDDADLRRGQPTVKSKWDSQIAMYTGDFVFALALELMTNVKSPLAHKILSNTIVEVTVGEIQQIKDKYRFDQNFRDYLRRIKRKTALLIAASCQLGAIAAGVEESVHKKLFRYGYYVGMSFQITDDILDFTATEKDLGKPAGSDLLHGNITAPALFAMEQDLQIKSKISTVNETTKPHEMKEIIQMIKQSGAIEKSFALSDLYLNKALAVLDELPQNKARKALYDIAKNIGRRKS